MPQATFIMYHYVRELSLSRYPNIKGLRVHEFENQLNFLSTQYQFVTVEKCLEAIQDPSIEFPENAALLTFDDGYLEHFTEVFPILDSRGIQGAFFPPVQAILEHKVLDVNKIHFILASTLDSKKIAQRINDKISDLAKDYNLEDPEYYLNKLSDMEHRYDPPEIVYIKRLLQRELPEEPSSIIIDELFAEYVGVKERVFAKELYLNVNHIQCMLQHGMFFGGHGYSHKWLNNMEEVEQEFEVDKTKDFLNKIGLDMDRWVMCYPYGAYDESLIQILKKKNCAMGIGTNVGVANLDKQHAFTLNRFDTNDFPKGDI